MHSPNSKPVVLYVDDDADDRLLLADALQLEAPDYQIQTAENGNEALVHLRSCADSLPCLVIIDLNMPGMNGKELIRHIKEDHLLQTLPVVAFTTSANPLDRQACDRWGVDMITKPLTFSNLKETVGILLQYCNT
jgi:CheY-like chemotaxis protein